MGIVLDEPAADVRERWKQLVERAQREEPVLSATPSEKKVAPPMVPAKGVAVLEVQTVKTPARSGVPTELPAAPPPSNVQRTRSKQGPIVGIDMGTSYTSVCAVVDGKIRVLNRDDGSASSPSVLYFPREGDVVVGPLARQKLATEPTRTVISPKRLIGRRFDDPEVQTFVSRLAFRTMAAPDDTTVVEVGGRQYAIPQLCALLLKDIVGVAEKKLGTRVEQAVISVPVSFDERRINALMRAAELARLDVTAVLDEPSAAALANRFTPQFGGIVGVYDFGGGTFDFSLVDVSGGNFEVLTTAGDTWLGGDDVDHVLASAAADQFWRLHKIDLRNQAVEWQRLLFACEEAKRALGWQSEAVIHVPEVLRTGDGMVDLNISINRPILARACAALVQRSLETCDQALSLVDLKPTDLSAVFLSGGTTYLEPVQNSLLRHFQVPICTGVPPEHAVCLGTAIHAAQIERRAKLTLGADQRA
jgi:molecular chaperone DnaK